MIDYNSLVDAIIQISPPYNYDKQDKPEKQEKPEKVEKIENHIYSQYDLNLNNFTAEMNNNINNLQFRAE